MKKLLLSTLALTMMVLKRLYWIAFLVSLFPAALYAGLYNEPGKSEGYYETLDITTVTDGNIPYMQAAGAGFGDSPLSRTDANTVTLKSASGQAAVFNLYSDAGEDNSDKWRVVTADGGDVTLETYQSGAWVAVATWSNAGGYTVTGALAIGTTDLDGTPPIGRTTIKGSTNDGSTNILVGRDSDNVNVFVVDTNGNITTSGMVNSERLTMSKINVADTDYNPSALTTNYLIAFTSLTAARACTISTEDEDVGTATQPRVMIIKDESGKAGLYPITITLESGGLIDGAASFTLNQPYQSVSLYLNGTNAFIY